MGTTGVDADVRAVVLPGSGRAFSAGGDIDMFAGLAGDVTRVRPHLRLVYDAFCSVERCAVPVVAAVNGLAYGGGSELAPACDIVLSSASSAASGGGPGPGAAAVNGLAYGGGSELALACDIVLAAESARFAFKEP